MNRISDNSFESINYALRPNKVIARRIIFDCLRRISHPLNLADATYVGMGSLWFVDFMLAHRALGIAKMVSIEASDTGYARASFNAPLQCIKVRHGYTTDVLPELRLDKRKHIVWLDHDTTVRGPVVDDIDTVGSECRGGSIALFTVNASLKKFKEEISSRGTDNVGMTEIRTALHARVGDSAPTTLSNNDLTEVAFARVIGAILENRIRNAMREAGRIETFLKLFDFVYQDGPPMVTVGGLIGSPELARSVAAMVGRADWPGIVTHTIRTPPLTLREKMALDRMLPRKKAPSAAAVRKHAGFPLSRSQIDDYFRYYAHYPTFAEFQV